MLKDDFYTIVEIKTDENHIEALLKINESHLIFQGHFPDHPVVPGVCLMQMVKEILGFHFRRKIRLSAAENIKFLQMITPERTKTIRLQIIYKRDVNIDYISVSAKILDKNIVCFKLSGIYVFEK